ncbi:hypothetical protein MHBO_000674 [Bonamia ostreae]|uniref:Phosphatidate cytidylyltransferase n=1 Tax=Bonamia ostreae TaxID=126728 RepID=A0ABV2AH34_9EUKA
MVDRKTFHTLKIRVKSSIFLGIGFVLFIQGGHFAMLFLGLLIQIMMYNEIISVGRKKYLKEISFNNLHWFIAKFSILKI